MLKKLYKKYFSFEAMLVVMFCIFFMAGATFLSYYEHRQISSDEQNDWWVIYFNNPKDNSADFTIKNNSLEGNFTWEIYMDKLQVQHGKETVPKGAVETIRVKTADLTDKKIKIVVTDEKNNRKEIYKIISND